MGQGPVAPPGVAVPFIDLTYVHAGLKERLLDDISSLIESGEFVNGAAVARFEERFAAYCGSEFCVGLSSGLDALRLALVGAGLGRGDEVIVPAHSFVATAEAVTQAGGTPVCVDVTENDYNLDVDGVRAALTPSTRAVLPVHLYGQLANMSELESLAARHDLLIVEDACQAHGATRDERRAGTTGAAGCFSFYPGKNLGAFGDAGACVTDDVEVADRVRALREHGQSQKHDHTVEGYTARLDTLQALVLMRKLPLLEAWNTERRAAAKVYTTALEGVGDLILPPVPTGSNPVWHLYVIRTATPERLADFLSSRRIATGRHYPVPIHLTTAYSWLGHQAGEFPVAERLATHGLSLPIFPGITEEQLDAVVGGITDYFRKEG